MTPATRAAVGYKRRREANKHTEPGRSYASDHGDAPVSSYLLLALVSLYSCASDHDDAPVSC